MKTEACKTFVNKNKFPTWKVPAAKRKAAMRIARERKYRSLKMYLSPSFAFIFVESSAAIGTRFTLSKVGAAARTINEIESQINGVLYPVWETKIPPMAGAIKAASA